MHLASAACTRAAVPLGYRALAGVEKLKELEQGYDFDVHVHPPVRVSDSRFPARLSGFGGLGRRAPCPRMLGRPFACNPHPPKGAGSARGCGAHRQSWLPTAICCPQLGLRYTINGWWAPFSGGDHVGNRPPSARSHLPSSRTSLDFEPMDLDEKNRWNLSSCSSARRDGVALAGGG